MLHLLATNSKKITQEHLKLGAINCRRLEVTIQVTQELIVLSNLLDELWEHPSGEHVVRILGGQSLL